MPTPETAGFRCLCICSDFSFAWSLNKYMSNYRIYLEIIWLVPKCLNEKPDFKRVMLRTRERAHKRCPL